MASNTAKTRLIRKKKDKPNRANLKAFQKRLSENARILRELASQEEAGKAES